MVWDNCTKSSADKRQKLQNRAARILTFSSYDTNAYVLIEELGWRKIESKRKNQKAIKVYKSINELASDYSRLLFNSRKIVTSYTLRDTDGKQAVPTPRTNYLKNSVAYSGGMSWNSHPIHLRKAI